MSFNLGNMWSKSKKNNYIGIVKKQQNNFRGMVKVNKNTRLLTKSSGKMGTKGFWGKPTWILFHSLAEKANDEKYKVHYNELWDFIRNICGGLPCPYCRADASKYINNIPLSSVNTKDKLKKVLFDFHNYVNIKTGKSVENINILEKYKNANLKKILEFFIARFFVSYIGSRHFNDWYNNKLKERTYVFWRFYIENIL
tara:strand:- start:2042 stop:2635 length:594 start_codon:yes stop_codon:yes gene_type:complete